MSCTVGGKLSRKAGTTGCRLSERIVHYIYIYIYIYKICQCIYICILIHIHILKIPASRCPYYITIRACVDSSAMWYVHKYRRTGECVMSQKLSTKYLLYTLFPVAFVSFVLNSCFPYCLHSVSLVWDFVVVVVVLCLLLL